MEIKSTDVALPVHILLNAEVPNFFFSPHQTWGREFPRQEQAGEYAALFQYYLNSTKSTLARSYGLCAHDQRPCQHPV